MKWKAPTCPTTDEDELQGIPNGGPKAFKFLVNPHQSHHSGNKQKGGSVFVFGKTKAEITQEKQNPYSSGLNVGSGSNTQAKAEVTPERVVSKKNFQAQYKYKVTRTLTHGTYYQEESYHCSKAK